MGAIECVIADVQIHNQPSQPEPESKLLVTRNPERISSAPTIAGTRLPVSTLIDYLSDGYTVAEFLDDFEGAVKVEQIAAIVKTVNGSGASSGISEEVQQIVMKKKTPKKPTQPYGRIVFSKDGSVSKQMFRLSDEKQTQEREVIERFANLYNEIDDGNQISEIRQLPEYDHDFSITLGKVKVQVQLTELVERSFISPITEEEVKTKKGEDIALKWSGGVLFRIDIEQKNAALTNLIKQKLDMNYAKSSDTFIWLVVFSTSPYCMEYVKGGQLYMSEGLAQAQEYLKGLSRIVFGEVWFTNLQTRPIKVWPISSEIFIREGDA
jgi:uncharacterized protein (DUF433 family)